MAGLSQHDLQIITEHDQQRNTLMMEAISRIGVQLRIAHFTGDSSYPTEYTLRYSFVTATGPTFDLAISSFIEKLLKYVPVEKA